MKNLDFLNKHQDLTHHQFNFLNYYILNYFSLIKHFKDNEVPDAGEYYHDHSFVKISDSFSTKGYGFGASKSRRFDRIRVNSQAGPGQYESKSSLSNRFSFFSYFFFFYK